MNLKKKIRNLVYNSKFLTSLYQVIQLLRGRGHFVSIDQISFEGWNMATGTRTPWMNGGGNKISQDFFKVDQQLKNLVQEKKINLSQLIPENTQEELKGLTWRHYIVFWSATFASQNTKSKQKNLVECGVCDGLTSFYAISALKINNSESTAYLYDAWEGMREDLLKDSEKQSAGSYSYLSLNSTKSNLDNLKNPHLIFNKGYIPESFAISENPESLVWLHLDLNSVAPTMSSMDYFWDKLEVGGLILFDDFAWPGYQDTQVEIEKWIANKNGNLLQFPTGQAIFIKLGA